MLGKTDASLVKNFLTTSDAPHLDTKALIQKQDKVAKAVDLDVSTIVAEQMKDPILGNVQSWIRKNTPTDTKSPEIQQSKGILRYRQELNRLLIEEEGQLLCYNEPSGKLGEENLRICLPLSPLLACFQLGHCNEKGGHMAATKTYANANSFYYWPGMFDWICALTADCLTCQNNKPEPKHRNEIPLEEWQNETVPFRTVHLDHKGSLHPTSASIVHCLVIIHAFSLFLMVYPVGNTTALATISAVSKWILSFEIPQSIIHDRVEALPFLIQNSSTGPKNLELSKDLVQLIHPRQIVKLKPRTTIFLGTGEFLSTMLETTGLHLHRSLHSSTTQVSTIQKEKPRMKLSLGPNHKSLCQSNWHFIGINTNFAVQVFVRTSSLTIIARTV